MGELALMLQAAATAFPSLLFHVGTINLFLLVFLGVICTRQIFIDVLPFVLEFYSEENVISFVKTLY